MISNFIKIAILKKACWFQWRLFLFSGFCIVIGEMQFPAFANPVSAREEAIILLLSNKTCEFCDLSGVRLSSMDLRNSRLKGSNLSGAILDHTDLRNADLRDTDLTGSMLREARLENANFDGATLQGADLSFATLQGADIEAKLLLQADWHLAYGVDTKGFSDSELHKSAFIRLRYGDYRGAEQRFSSAIRENPLSGISWLGRAISRDLIGDVRGSKQDFEYSIQIYSERGQLDKADEVRSIFQRSMALKSDTVKNNDGANGSLRRLAEALLPLALKLFSGGLL